MSALTQEAHYERIRERVGRGWSWMCAKTPNTRADSHLMCRGTTGPGRVVASKRVCTCPCHQEAKDAE